MKTLTSIRLNYQHLLDKQRVYADLNAGWKVGDNYIVPLNSRATESDLRQLGLSLASGLVVDFWTDDGDDKGNPDPLLFRGTIQFDEDAQKWIAVALWNDFHNASELDMSAGDSTPVTRSATIDGSIEQSEMTITSSDRPGAVSAHSLKKI